MMDFSDDYDSMSGSDMSQELWSDEEEDGVGGLDDDHEDDDSFIVNDSSSMDEGSVGVSDEDESGMDTSNILSTRLRSAPKQTVRYWDEYVDDSIMWADADARDVFEPLRSDDDILSGDEVFSDDDDLSD
jgi:hypothetical protein